MQIDILLFGPVREMAGADTIQVDVPADATVDAVAAALAAACPRMAHALPPARFAVNGAFATGDVVLQKGDEVAVIPPVSGG